MPAWTAARDNPEEQDKAKVPFNSWERRGLIRMAENGSFRLPNPAEYQQIGNQLDLELQDNVAQLTLPDEQPDAEKVEVNPRRTVRGEGNISALVDNRSNGTKHVPPATSKRDVAHRSGGQTY